MGRNIEDTGIGDGHVTGLISDYIDGTLAPAAQERVRAHIAVCQDCRTDYIELKAVQQMLHSVPLEAPPRAFTLTQEMVGTGQHRPQSFLARLLAPAFAPRLAGGSVLAFALLLLVLVIAPGAPRNSALDMSPSGFQNQSAYNAAPGGAPAGGDRSASTPGATSKQAQFAPTSTPAISAMSAVAALTDTASAADGQVSMPMAVQATSTALADGSISGGAGASTSSIINTPPSTSNLPPIDASGNSSPTTVASDLPGIVDANPSAAQPPSSASPSNQGNLLSTLAEAALGILGTSLAAAAVLARQRRF